MVIFGRARLELPELPGSKIHQPTSLGPADMGYRNIGVRPFRLLLRKERKFFTRNSLRKVEVTFE